MIAWQRSSARFIRRGSFWLWGIVGLAILSGGCTRRHYRVQADNQTSRLWKQFTTEAAQPLTQTGIQIQPESRLFDPFDPDHEAMPPDDPVAHTRMHRVDGKKAYRRWGKFGQAGEVDDQHWRQFLPYDPDGHVVLDREGAVQLAYLNSRNYQKELEDLYLSALDVTFERFRFDAQFFLTNVTTIFTDGRLQPGAGNRSRTTITNDAVGSVEKLYAGGGQLVVELANSIIWQVAGPDTNNGVSILNFNFVQPLLRFGGRARILERLTFFERSLIYNVRQFEQYRQGFYAQVVTGRDPGNGPSTSGLGSGVGTPLPSYNGIGGYFGLLNDQVLIRNQEANVSTLRDSLTRLQDEFDANRLSDKFQVELARQALYQGQSRLLASKAAFQTSLDNFKILLGLPPDLQVRLNDDLLKPFELIDPQVTRLTELAGRIALKVHKPEAIIGAGDLAELIDNDTGIRREVERHLELLEQDYANLLENVPAREAQLQKLLQRPEVVRSEVDPAAYSVTAFQDRVKILRRDIDALRVSMNETWTTLEKLRDELPKIKPEEARERLKRAHPDLSSQLLALTLAKARARVDAITWTQVELTPPEALETARENRRDWMNARAQLVDTWRLIEFNANALKAGLNFVMHGDIRTENENPLNFRDATGRLRMGVEFDAPLTRLAERNIYRASLISYQQNRRAYMLFEDRINQNLRLILRTLELNQLNFEIRRSAVQVAIQQVDLARENLNRPPKINETAASYAAARASIGRDVVSALSDLLSTQNDFLGVWVSYEVQRLNLDFEMGTMLLDDRGMWIDPGPVQGDPNFGGELVDGVPADDDAAPLPLPPGAEPLPRNDVLDPLPPPPVPRLPVPNAPGPNPAGPPAAQPPGGGAAGEVLPPGLKSLENPGAAGTAAVPSGAGGGPMLKSAPLP
jgi:hypothetical protein